MKKDKRSLRGRICRALDLPPDVMPRCASLELHGRELMKIHGGGRILLYTDSEIRVALRADADFISVKGEGLSCVFYNRGAVGIEGKIVSFAFCEEDIDGEK